LQEKIWVMGGPHGMLQLAPIPLAVGLSSADPRQHWFPLKPKPTVTTMSLPTALAVNTWAEAGTPTIKHIASAIACEAR